MNSNTTTTPLAGAELKIQRAQHHIELLGDAVRTFIDSGAFAETARFYLDGALARPVGTPADPAVLTGQTFFVAFHFLVRRHPPPEWGPLIGDVLHNLRSALDHIAFELAGSAAGKHTEFPICSSREAFVLKGRQQRLNGIPLRAVSLIKWLQPYRRGASARSHPLWILHELNNLDKHRTLHVAGAAMFDPVVDMFSVENARTLEIAVRHIGPMEHGTPFAVVRLEVPRDARSDPALGRVPVHMKTRLKTRKTVAFAGTEVVDGGEVVPTLSELLTYVRDQVLLPIRHCLT